MFGSFHWACCPGVEVGFQHRKMDGDAVNARQRLWRFIKFFPVFVVDNYDTQTIKFATLTHFTVGKLLVFDRRKALGQEVALTRQEEAHTSRTRAQKKASNDGKLGEEMSPPKSFIFLKVIS